MAHTCNLSTWEADMQIFVSLRPAWFLKASSRTARACYTNIQRNPFQNTKTRRTKKPKLLISFLTFYLFYFYYYLFHFLSIFILFCVCTCIEIRVKHWVLDLTFHLETQGLLLFKLLVSVSHRCRSNWIIGAWGSELSLFT